MKYLANNFTDWLNLRAAEAGLDGTTKARHPLRGPGLPR